MVPLEPGTLMFPKLTSRLSDPGGQVLPVSPGDSHNAEESLLRSGGKGFWLAEVPFQWQIREKFLETALGQGFEGQGGIGWKK